MNKIVILFLLSEFSIPTYMAQQTLIKGSVNEPLSFKPIQGVKVTIEETQQFTLTNNLGEFIFDQNIPLGEQVLRISKSGYITKRYPIIVNEGKMVIISDMILETEFDDHDLYTIILSDDELNNETTSVDNLSGVLVSSRDVFQRTSAFEFSPSFFKIRGLGSESSELLINGITMNKLYNGRPQWSNWGGLNDVMRNQELVFGLGASSYSFGGLLGNTNIIVRASQMRPGRRLTYSFSNRSYSHRLMGTNASGLVKNGWAYTVSIGRRWGNEGYQNATLYDANSFFASVEKQLHTKHSLNLTAIYTPNRRGKSSPNTQEVYNLKGIKYNEYWGWQDGEKRNSRIKKIKEPVVMLNHYWNINHRTSLNTNMAYQFGSIGNSRLDYNGTDLINGFPEGGGSNPSPTYYQKLPSYFERNNPENLGLAYLAQKEFIRDGQVNWRAMYQANGANTQNGGNAIYALYEDKVDDKQITINTIFNSQLNDWIKLNVTLDYKTLKSENYAQVTDLFGATGYLDIDGYATDFNKAQNDLLNLNRIVGPGDKFKYHYNIEARVMSAFAQAQFEFDKLDFYISGNFNSTSYQRDGLYKNGAFPDNSYGKGDRLTFSGFGIKTGMTYKFTGQHFLDGNFGFITKAPSIQNTFTNSRENHNVIPQISEEKGVSLDASYIYRSPIIKAKLTGFFTKIMNANEVSFYFADGIRGDNTAFIQEILQGVHKKFLGGELGIEAQITPTIKLKAVSSVGQYTYDNNPKLFLSTETGEAFEDLNFVDGFRDFGESNLKDYKLAVGPHRAYSLGLEYQDPEYWWFGATVNLFTNTYIDINPLTRSSNFTSNFDGIPFSDYDEVLGKALLNQERFDDYILVNLTGGKSWRIGSKYIGLFASVNNLLDKVYKTGGFEQGRNANFRQLRDDRALETPVFGSKYWYGRGTSYFLNLNVRF